MFLFLVCRCALCLLRHQPEDELKLIVGGETTMWAECVDAVNFDSVVWPRAAAAASVQE